MTRSTLLTAVLGLVALGFSAYGLLGEQFLAAAPSAAYQLDKADYLDKDMALDKPDMLDKEMTLGAGLI